MKSIDYHFIISAPLPGDAWGVRIISSRDGEAVSNGVVKMNIDTDTQWAYWDGLRGFYKKNEGYLQGQV